MSFGLMLFVRKGGVVKRVEEVMVGGWEGSAQRQKPDTPLPSPQIKEVAAFT